jgi:hypothetical protein
LTADDKDDDGIPLVKPISCGRDGQAPIIIYLPTLRDEAFAIADQLSEAHKEGHAWGDMAILCRDYSTRDLCAQVLHQRQMPVQMRRNPGDYRPHQQHHQVMTMKVSKGLEFPVVALPGVGHGGRCQPGCAGGEGRAGGGAGVLCGGDTGYAEVGDWGGWGWGVWKAAGHADHTRKTAVPHERHNTPPQPAPADSLHAELRTLIASSRQRLAGAVNAELTRLYWSVGERLRTEVLGGADRAKYGDQLIQRLGDQLAQEFGRGFEAKNLRRMVQFAQAFPQPEIVATLSRQLSWSHFVNLLPLKTEPARQFYASQAATRHLERARAAPPDRTQGLRAHRACHLQSPAHARSG